MLPNLIIAGAPKSGTSSLHSWLSDHPNAVGSTPKETYYFVDPGTHMFKPETHIQNGLDDYFGYFSDDKKTDIKIVLEATPAYIYYDTALNHLPDLETQPKFLFILREPPSQIYSLYTYFKSNWDWIPSGMPFSEFVEIATAEIGDFKGNELARYAIRYARYVDYLRRWKDRVGSERMTVRLFDDLKADPVGFTKDISKELGLDPTFFDTYEFPRDNETYAVKSPILQKLNLMVREKLPKGRLYEQMRSFYRGLNTEKPSGPQENDQDVILKLRREFAEDNKALSAEFGLDLTAWGV